MSSEGGKLPLVGLLLPELLVPDAVVEQLAVLGDGVVVLDVGVLELWDAVDLTLVVALDEGQLFAVSDEYAYIPRPPELERL